MYKTSEIYLTKNYVLKKEWEDLINVISNYNGLLKNWKIIIENNSNQLRYFIKSDCSLPATINGLNAFLMKNIENNKLYYSYLSLPFFTNTENNIIDIINYLEIKNKGTLNFIEITFKKLSKNNIKKKIVIYLTKNGNEKKYRLLLSNPTNILSVDFDNNKRYFFKSAPKYLDINKILHLLSTDINSSIFKIDTFPYLQGDFYLNQNNFSFDKHSVVLGASGTGKSKFLSLLINNIYKNSDLKQRYKIVIIDPHATLEDDIGGISRVIDFKTTLDSIDLFINNPDDVISSTELLLELFKSLIADQYNSKLERVLRHSIYVLLLDNSFNFSNLRKILLELEYRNFLIKKLKNKLPISVIEFFLTDFNDLKTKAYGEAVSPIIAFIDEMEMIPVFNNQTNEDNLRKTIYDNFLTLFSLDRTKLGDKVTKTISGLVMQQLLSLIQNHSFNEHIIFIVDEVAVIENPILCRFLAEARKYNLSLILAGQYFSQITDKLKNAIFANVINYYIFRVSKMDANILVDNFNMKIPLDDTRDKKIKMLTELNNRECILRIDSNDKLLPAFKASTISYESIPRIKKANNLEKNNVLKTDCKFTIGNNVNLKDILLSSSTRKVDNK
ncbi:putative uncharacterized protein [Firmicutes bacterium CAG:582]|mgnify:FL=1|nr:putative uncharacterized protein [Firmicutes bacterium CAG:582]